MREQPGGVRPTGEAQRALNKVDAGRTTGPQGLLPEEDFSPQANTMREAQANVDATKRIAALANIESSYQQRKGAVMGRGGAALEALSEQRKTEIADLVSSIYNSKHGDSLAHYPSLITAVAQANANGANITKEDINRLASYATADRAANMYINAPDDQRRKNILLTASPIMRAAILDVVEEKLAALGKETPEQSGNVLINALTQGAGAVLAPFAWANEQSQHLFRAGIVGQDVGQFDPLQAVQAGFHNITKGTSGWVTDWNATDVGDFDPAYIQTLRAQYPPVAVDTMLEIAQEQARGNPDPIITVLQNHPEDAEVADVVRQLIYRPDTSPELMELGRQIDSANRGSTGQLAVTQAYTPDSARYSPFRGSQGREVYANVNSVLYAFALDPTIAASKAIKAYRVARWSLDQLFPGAKSATVALRSRKVAGVETNAARRYVNSFTRALRHLDDLEATNPTKAAGFRMLMSRHYKEYPEEVIEEFRNQGIRSTDDFTAFVDNSNASFLLRAGEAVPLGESLRAFDEIPFAERLFGHGMTQTREALIPTLSVARTLRQQAVRAINATVTPRARGEAVVASEYGGQIAGVTERLSRSDAPEVGVLDRTNDFGVPGALTEKADAFMRQFSSLPNSRFLHTGDARDTRNFYKLARTFLTKSHADFLAEAWRTGTEGERRLLAAGLAATAAGTQGVKGSREEILRAIGFTTSREGELYSVGRVATIGEREGDELLPMTADEAAENTITKRPSLVNGVESAIHLYQTTDNVAMFTLHDIEQMKAWRSLVPPALQSAPQRLTDLWSIGTLYGLRFSMRNMAEDMWSYVITGGRVPYLSAGRRMSTAFRDATQQVKIARYKTSLGSHQKGQPILDEHGNPRILMKSRLGMFAKVARNVGNVADDHETNWLGRMLGTVFLGDLDEAATITAMDAARQGDMLPLQKLVVEAAARQRLTGITPQMAGDLHDLMGTPFGLKVLDDVAETARQTQSGLLPSLEAAAPGTDMIGVAGRVIEKDATTAYGNFIPIAPDGHQPGYNMFWQRNIEGVVAHDGPMGTAALRNIDDPERAVAAVRDVILNDDTFRYRDRFSSLYTGALTVDEFARRYVDDVLTTFSDRNGNLLTKLVDKVAPRNAEGIRQPGLVDETADGDLMRVTPQWLRSTFQGDNRPAYVLGRETIQFPKDETNLLDRAWSWMGEQYARIAREPVYFANYLEQRAHLRAYQTTLTEVIGEDAARAHVTNMATDRAYQFTLNYVDNPANRSQLAWKVRNFARYYRATEDFYRRMFRVAKNYPEGFWKTALTYQVLDDTGMIFTDDRGNKYFAYPGNEMLQAAVGTGLKAFMGTESMDLDPAFFGGQVKMLAPSSNPDQFFPNLTGPVGVVPAKLLFDHFPGMQGLEKYFVGDYGAQQSILDAVLPAGIARMMNTLSTDERDSTYANAIKDSIAIAVANDLLPTTDASGNPIQTTDQFKGTEAWRAIQRIAMGTVITRALLGFIAPASPQTYVDNVTPYARKHGIDSMRDAWNDLVAAKFAAGEPDAMTAAFNEWWTLHPDGKLMPFTVSKTQDADVVANLADVDASKQLQDWYNDNTELIEKFPDAALFLAPKHGDFTYSSWDLLTSTLGLKIDKGFDQFMNDVFSATANSQWFATYDDYQGDIDKVNPNTEDGKKQIATLTAQRKADLDWLESTNPFLAKDRAEFNWALKDQQAQTAYNETKSMVEWMKVNGRDTDDSRYIRSAILTYEDYMSDIKAVTGSTEAEDAWKRTTRADMNASLNSIAEKSENAATFIKNVLGRTPDIVALNSQIGGE